MPVQLEFNLDQKDPIEHVVDMWAKAETSNQRKFRRLFAEQSHLKKRLNAVEKNLLEKREERCNIVQFDLFMEA